MGGSPPIFDRGFMKKKVLMVTEFSQLPTGYSVYSKELLSRLGRHFDIAELACYCSSDNPQISSVPWKVYPNKPLANTPEYQQYKSSPTAEFGEFSFNSVLLDYQPDFVIDIRDFWMMSFEHNSPFRKFYKHCIMPTVDATPQNIEWIDTYSQADAVFTYSEFGRDTLLKQNPSISFKGVASPCASHSFHPIKDKKALRESFGMDDAPFIIGTVMRNQRRKLYPDLFVAFRKFLDETKRNDVFLYCHTSYPDVGWDIPSLLIQNNLMNRVLFTYKCSKCGHISCAFFSDVMKNCNHCNTFNSGICGINNPLSETELSRVYNIFDVYVQYANSEGFGMPQLEAAQCGNLVLSINYSAMESVINNIDGIPLRYTSLAVEAETGCLRAIPDNEYFVKTLKSIINDGKKNIHEGGRTCYINTISKYNWDKTAAVWIDYIASADIIPIQESWKSPINIKQPAPLNNLTTPSDQATFLISEVLCKPELIGGYLWRRLLKELTYKSTVENLNSFYINEHHYKDALKMKPFTYKDAYDSMVSLRTYYNTWEQHRAKYL